MLLNQARNRTTLLLGGSILNTGSQNYPSYFMIGAGSATVTVNSNSLTTPSDRQTVTTTTYPNSQKVRWQGDWNSTEMSGLTLSEFGMTGSETGTNGSMWSKVVFPSINFDGTLELQTQETWEVY